MQPQLGIFERLLLNVSEYAKAIAYVLALSNLISIQLSKKSKKASQLAIKQFLEQSPIFTQLYIDQFPAQRFSRTPEDGLVRADVLLSKMSDEDRVKAFYSVFKDFCHLHRLLGDDWQLLPADLQPTNGEIAVASRLEGPGETVGTGSFELLMTIGENLIQQFESSVSVDRGAINANFFDNAAIYFAELKIDLIWTGARAEIQAAAQRAAARSWTIKDNKKRKPKVSKNKAFVEFAKPLLATHQLWQIVALWNDETRENKSEDAARKAIERS